VLPSAEANSDPCRSVSAWNQEGSRSEHQVESEVLQGLLSARLEMVQFVTGVIISAFFWCLGVMCSDLI
jgi:hypothetical protein